MDWKWREKRNYIPNNGEKKQKGLGVPDTAK